MGHTYYSKDHLPKGHPDIKAALHSYKAAPTMPAMPKMPSMPATPKTPDLSGLGESIVKRVKGKLGL